MRQPLLHQMLRVLVVMALVSVRNILVRASLSPLLTTLLSVTVVQVTVLLASLRVVRLLSASRLVTVSLALLTM